jgi:hypothetical protein
MKGGFKIPLSLSHLVSIFYCLLFYFGKFYYWMCMSVWPECMHHLLSACVSLEPIEARRRGWHSWNWNCKWLRAATSVLRTKWLWAATGAENQIGVLCKSSQQSALNYGVIFPAPVFLIMANFFVLFCLSRMTFNDHDLLLVSATVHSFS